MTDFFDLLQEPRRPWLDPAALRSRFIELSSGAHPDRVHTASEADKLLANERYQNLNAAHTVLREPRERLLHLLELERGTRPGDIQRIPPGTMDLFVEVGQTCRDTDTFLAGRAQATSPLVKVQWFGQAQAWTDKLMALQKAINQRRDSLIAELQSMNAAWETAPPPPDPDRPAALPLDRLEQIYRIFSYVSRWTEQVQERIVQLAF
jgi:hypothetical protein